MLSSALMRALGVVAAVWLWGCSGVGGGGAPTLTLEVLSPKAGEVAAAVSYRLKLTGANFANVFATEVGKSRVIAQAECRQNLDVPCEGTLEFPPSFGEQTYEVWAAVGTNNPDLGDYRTPAQQVRINSDAIVVAPLVLNNARLISIVTSGANDLDPASLASIRVERRFARLPYIALTDNAEFGFGTLDVPVTATMRSQFLELRGDLRGPAQYTLHLEGVRNRFGQRIKEPVTVDQAFFGASTDIGDVFISGVGISPHFEKAADGRLFLVYNGHVQQLVDGAWTDVATWTSEERALVAPDGTPYLFSADAMGGVVRRWNGSAWQELPRAPAPVPRTNNDGFYASAAMTRAGVLHLVTMRTASFPNMDAFIVSRWDGTQWQVLSERSFMSALPREVSLLRFGDGVALDVDRQLEAISGTTFTQLPDPKPALDALGPYASFTWHELRHDAAGTPWLLGRYTDASISMVEPAIGDSAFATLKFEGGAWTVVTKGSLLDQAWKPTADGSDLFIKEVLFRSWGFDKNGVPAVFTRETVNPFGSDPTLSRFNVAGYSANGARWAPFANAPTPLLSDELHRLPSPFPPMAPVVLFDAAWDANGRMWTVSQVGNHSNVALTTFVLNAHL